MAVTILTYLLYAGIAVIAVLVLEFVFSVSYMRRNHISILDADKVAGQLLRSGYSCALVGFLPFSEWLKPNKDQIQLHLRKYIRSDGVYGLEMQIPKRARKDRQSGYDAILTLAAHRGYELFIPHDDSSYHYIDFEHDAEGAAEFVRRAFIGAFGVQEEDLDGEFRIKLTKQGIDRRGRLIESTSQHPSSYANYTLYPRPRKRKKKPTPSQAKG